jgi:hypothetical protein
MRGDAEFWFPSAAVWGAGIQDRGGSTSEICNNGADSEAKSEADRFAVTVAPDPYDDDSMLPSPLSASDLARRLIPEEPGVLSSAVAETVEVACNTFRAELTGPMGSGGVSALLGRALSLAKKGHPVLDPVTLADDASRCFAGLSTALEAGTAETARAAGASILTHLFGLLVLLLGEELGMQPLHKLWPQLPPGTKGIPE